MHNKYGVDPKQELLLMDQASLTDCFKTIEYFRFRFFNSFFQKNLKSIAFALRNSAKSYCVIEKFMVRYDDFARQRRQCYHNLWPPCIMRNHEHVHNSSG